MRSKSPHTSDSSFRMAWSNVEDEKENQDLNTVPSSEYSAPIMEPKKPRPPRIKSAPLPRPQKYTKDGLRDHCRCTCHLENFNGMTPTCLKTDRRHYVTRYSRPNSAVSTSSRGTTPRPASSASAVSQGHTYSRSRPQSAPPAFHRAFLKSQLLRQQLRAQLGSAPGLQYMGRHSRCHGQDHIHERLILNRPTQACDKCGTRCNKYCGSRASSPTRDIEQYIDKQSNGQDTGHDNRPLLIVAMVCIVCIMFES